jgi:hypothetical protein
MRFRFQSFSRLLGHFLARAQSASKAKSMTIAPSDRSGPGHEAHVIWAPHKFRGPEEDVAGLIDIDTQLYPCRRGRKKSHRSNVETMQGKLERAGFVMAVHESVDLPMPMDADAARLEGEGSVLARFDPNGRTGPNTGERASRRQRARARS